MPIELSWDDPDRSIIYTKITGLWTWKEMYTVSEESIIMRQSVNHPVGAIVDFRLAKGLPDDAHAHTKNILIRQESYAAATVFVGLDFAAKSLWTVLFTVYKPFIKHQHFYFANSLEEARTTLSQTALRQKSTHAGANPASFQAETNSGQA